MTATDKLIFLKKLVGTVGPGEDSLLTAYLSVAGSAILSRLYPFGNAESEEVPLRYAVKQCEIAQYLYNKQGAEGETSHSENGVSRTYENGSVPESMLRDIVPFGRTLK